MFSLLSLGALLIWSDFLALSLWASVCHAAIGRAVQSSALVTLFPSYALIFIELGGKYTDLRQNNETYCILNFYENAELKTPKHIAL